MTHPYFQDMNFTPEMEAIGISMIIVAGVLDELANIVGIDKGTLELDERGEEIYATLDREKAAISDFRFAQACEWTQDMTHEQGLELAKTARKWGLIG